MTPVTVFLSGTEPLLRDGVEVPVVYTALPENLHPGGKLYFGDHCFSITDVSHICDVDGQYERTLIKAVRNKPDTVKAVATGLTVRKRQVRM